MSRQHPYKSLEGHSVWKAIEKAITELEANGDLELSTARELVIGYLTKSVIETKPTAARLRAVRAKLRQTRRASESLAVALSELESKSHGR